MTLDERYSRHRYLTGWNQDRLAAGEGDPGGCRRAR